MRFYFKYSSDLVTGSGILCIPKVVTCNKLVWRWVASIVTAAIKFLSGLSRIVNLILDYLHSFDWLTDTVGKPLGADLKGLTPSHKEAMLLFLERVYGINDQELFFHLLEVGFLPDLRAATTMDTVSNSKVYCTWGFGLEWQAKFVGSNTNHVICLCLTYQFVVWAQIIYKKKL